MGHIGRLALVQNSWVRGIPPIHDETVDGWGTLDGLPCYKTLGFVGSHIHDETVDGWGTLEGLPWYKTLGFVGSHPSTMRLWMDGAHWTACPVTKLLGSWDPTSTMRLWMDGAHWKACPVRKLLGSWDPTHPR